MAARSASRAAWLAERARLADAAYRILDEGQFVWRAVTRRPHEPVFQKLQRLPLPSAALGLDVGVDRSQRVQSIRLIRPDARVVAFSPRVGTSQARDH